jgi:two-component system, cell cycle sensor histidine kinase and response regulator CckA
MEETLKTVSCSAKDECFTDLHATELLELQQQRWMALGRMASGLTHEFNNLLYVVSGYVGLIKAQVESSSKEIDTDLLLEQLNRIEEATLQAAELSRAILNFSRETPPQFERFSLHHFLVQLHQFMQPILSGCVEFDLILHEKNDFEIFGNQSLLRQALINLILNAKEACFEGGKVVLTYQMVSFETRWITQWTEILSPGRYIRIRVQDNGEGIAKETVSRLVEPYFTTKATQHQRCSTGTGLGLLMVQRCMQIHEGAMDCHSILNKGTYFDLYFPIEL